ncbi:MAG: C10 family peptidase [Prevotella sp.]|nr:C10 family peptidase [Prevotella sp.]
MKTNRVLTTVAVSMLAMMVVAAPRQKAQMKEAATKAINEQRMMKRMAPRQAAELKTLKTATGYEIMGFENGGFAVVSTDDLVPEVLGVSMSPYSKGENTNFQWWLDMINGAVEYAVTNNVALAPIAPNPGKYPTQVGPLMTTKWDQEGPYNNLLPNASGGGRVYTGCVATALAQVLNYFKVPEHGIGQRTIYYKGTPVTANFEADYYDWDNMRDTYNYGQYSNAEANAVAVLMRDCGVASNMDYGGAVEGGSGAYSTDAAEGMRKYFGFTEAVCYERDNYYGTKYYSDEDWMDMVFRALSEDGPIYYGGADSYNGGHAFVLHGYDATGKVYVNWGWSGDDDGYYDISLLNPGYYKFSIGQDMIIGIKGERRELVEKEIELANAGTLSTLITDEEMNYVGTLKLSGNINSSDLLFLRKMAGVDENNERTDGFLKDLDLSDAAIVEGGNPYLIDGSRRLTTTNDELPERAFYGCRQLQTLKLPAGLKHIGDGAFALCSQLGEIEIGTPAEDADFIIDDDGMVWNAADDKDLICVLPSASGELTIPSGTETIHSYALAGCSRLSKVVLPATLTTIGREAFRNASALQELRVNSKDVPTLTGNDVFAGMSTTSCALYVRSGTKNKFAQVAQWKDFINVVEFGTTVKVRNTIRNYGEENPEFTYQMIGDYVEGKPEITCEATPLSPAGRHTITISRGTITDETVEFEDGYLVVQKVKAAATVENATREAGQPNPEFTLTFSGLVNDETVPVWIEEPVFTVDADETSEPGEYPITVTAVAESYELTFEAGVLTITEATTGVHLTTVDDLSAKNEVFTLDGRRVNGTTLSKGVYIKNGKKYVVK